MVRMPIQNKIPTTLEGSVCEIHKIWQTCWIKDNSLSIKLAGRGSMLHTVMNMDLALPKMCWTMDLQGPTGHMAACDWTQTKKTSQDPGWWPITRWHHSFPSFIEVPHASPPSLIESPRRLPQDPAGIPPRFYQGIPLRVMVLDDLMALVLRTKSIGQWPLTLVDRTLWHL
jgi:hypothetical protein